MKLLRNLLIALLPAFFIFLTATTVHASTTLGGMDLNGWCAHNNEGEAALNSSNQWVCTGNNQVIDFTANPTPNCVWQYNDPNAFAQNLMNPTDPNYKYGWDCFTNSSATPIPTPTSTSTPTGTPTELGGMDLDGWCAHINETTAGLASDGQTWVCTGNNQPIDFTTQPTPNCVWQYNVSDAYAVNNLATTDPNYKYAWVCYTRQVIVPTPTATTVPTPAPTTPPAPTPVVTNDWASYKYDIKRDNFATQETVITPISVAQLKVDWSLPSIGTAGVAFGPASISDQPIEYNNIVYYGDWSGNFYARNLKDGSLVWTKNLGTDTPPAANNCNPPSLGIAGSAGVRTISVNGVQTPIVYIAGGDGNMYAFYASTGQLLWKTPLTDITKGGYLWDSPTLYNGSVYMGIASFGDCPLIQGEMVKMNWTTGQIQVVTKLVPNGCIGAGEWATPTVDTANNKIYITTGTQDNSCTYNGVKGYREPYALAMVEFDLNLNIVGAFRIPAADQIGDSDFGVSPTLTEGKINGVMTKLVSAVNKNGRLYVFKRDHVSDGPIIDEVLGVGGACPDCGQGSISTSATDGKLLYQGAGLGTVTINGQTYKSVIEAIDPTTGTILWSHNLHKALVASPSMVNGMLIVPEGNDVDFISTKDGSEIKQIVPPGQASVLDGPIAVARGNIIFGDLNGTFWDYGL